MIKSFIFIGGNMFYWSDLEFPNFSKNTLLYSTCNDFICVSLPGASQEDVVLTFNEKTKTVHLSLSETFKSNDFLDKKSKISFVLDSDREVGNVTLKDGILKLELVSVERTSNLKKLEIK